MTTRREVAASLLNPTAHNVPTTAEAISIVDGRPSSLSRVITRRGGRIVLLTEVYPPAVGGSAVLFHGIYSRLEKADVTVVTPPATSRWGVIDPRGLARHLRVAAGLRRTLSRRQGFVHCARALPEGVAAMIAQSFGGPGYVCWAHGEDLASAMTSRELTWLTKMVYRRSTAALANSRNTAGMLTAFGVPETKIHIVHPAVDADRFHPRVDGSAVRCRFSIGPNEVLLLSVGRLQRRKGHDVAIQAIAALGSRCPNLRYVIAGDGDERQRLERLVAEHHVEDRVFFAGIVADCDLPSFYAACDVFLLPNRVDEGDIEGFGIVFLEAAASGRPTIGGDSGGVPEAVERDVTGLLVDGASVEAVADAIAELATSDERRRRMGLAGRVRAQQCFSWQHAATRVSELQRRLVGGLHPSGASASVTAITRC
jgi:phosphatidylinositol alpha-1,6-mannosyltransferase